MGRVSYGAARNRKKNRLLKKVRGYRGAPGKRWRLAKETLVKAGVDAYRDRRLRKRNFRALWITRLTAACRMRGISYSRFVFGLNASNIELNRKMLSEIAIHSPADFDAIVETAKQHQPNAQAA